MYVFMLALVELIQDYLKNYIVSDHSGWMDI